jgi:tRNA (mo5U34)-methyltransferase
MVLGAWQTSTPTLRRPTDPEIIDAINQFPRWHYQFNLGGHYTPIVDRTHINRHEQRKAYFFDPLVRLFGGSLAGKRVLDLGCNAGFWSLCAIQSGCDYVFGIDGRQMHIDQAKFVFRVNEIDPRKYSFIKGDIFDVLNQTIGKFDIVLCLGLFYHISKHMTLLEAISRVNTDVLVIDTTLCTSRGSLLELERESLDDARNAIDHELVMRPTQSAVVEMVREFGYDIIALKPAFRDYTGALDYKQGKRRAFIAAKVTDPRQAHVAIEPSTSRSRPDVGGISHASSRLLARTLVSRALPLASGRRPDVDGVSHASSRFLARALVSRALRRTWDVLPALW